MLLLSLKTIHFNTDCLRATFFLEREGVGGGIQAKVCGEPTTEEEEISPGSPIPSPASVTAHKTLEGLSFTRALKPASNQAFPILFLSVGDIKIENKTTRRRSYLPSSNTRVTPTSGRQIPCPKTKSLIARKQISHGQWHHQKWVTWFPRKNYTKYPAEAARGNRKDKRKKGRDDDWNNKHNNKNNNKPVEALSFFSCTVTPWLKSLFIFPPL